MACVSLEIVFGLVFDQVRLKSHVATQILYNHSRHGYETQFEKEIVRFRIKQDWLVLDIFVNQFHSLYVRVE